MSAGLWGFNTELTKISQTNQKKYQGGSSDDHKLFKPRTSTLHTIVLLCASLPVQQNLKSKLQMFLIVFFGRNENLTFNISTNFAVGITGQFFEESILAYIEVDTKIKPFFACANRKRDK